MKTKFIIAAIAFFSIATINVNAQTVAKHQHQRIRQGVRSGQLTKAEAHNLRQDQRQIHQEVKTANNDGVVTPAERKAIRKDKKRESREIYRKKHNARDRN